MMKRIGMALLVGCIVMLHTSALSQMSLQVGPGIGVMVPQSDFGGNTIDYYAGQRYGLSTGIDLHGKVRLGAMGFKVFGELGYSSMSNDGNSEPGQGRVEVSQNIVRVKAGPEYHFSIPAAPLTPYVGASVALYRFSGETLFQGVSGVSSATYSVEAATRFGIGIHGGALVELGPLLSLDLQLGYNFMNVGGKSWNDVNPTQNQRIDSYLSLNDKRDPLFEPGDNRHFIYDDRTINSFQATVGLMFGL